MLHILHAGLNRLLSELVDVSPEFPWKPGNFRMVGSHSVHFCYGHGGHRFAVAVALPSFELDDQGLEALRRLTADADSDVRDWATFGLAASDATDASTVRALAARTDDADDDTRAEAIFGLARRRDPRARALIQDELARPSHGVLIERALEELGEAPD